MLLDNHLNLNRFFSVLGVKDCYSDKFEIFQPLKLNITFWYAARHLVLLLKVFEAYLIVFNVPSIQGAEFLLLPEKAKV